MSKLSPILNTAFKAARRAGNLMLQAANNSDRQSIQSGAIDALVLKMEEVIGQILSEAYPHHRLNFAHNPEALGEHGHEWVIQVLGGRDNYAHVSPHYAISMALLHKGVLQEALVYAPERNDLYVASRGQGAWLNDKRIRVSPHIELNTALIATDCAVAPEEFTQQMAMMSALVQKKAQFRHSGCVALDVCALAQGHIEGFVQINGVLIHDLASAALILQEAGGIITDEQGNETWLYGGAVVAGNPKILAHLLKILTH